MANTATLADSISAQIGTLTPVLEYEISIDTIDTELTVYTPASGKRVFVVGIWLSEGTAGNLTLISGSSSKSQTFELSANQGLSGLAGNGFHFATKPGEALKVRASNIITSTVGKNMILRLVEGEFFRLS